MLTKKLNVIKQPWIIAALVVALCGYGSAQTGGSISSLPVEPALPRLEREVARLAKGAGGVIGVSAVGPGAN